jgi:hypothetical protein
MENRRYHETLGYALEFLDHFFLFSQAHFGTQLYHNLHLQRFRHMERRVRQEEVAKQQGTQLELDIYPDANRYYSENSEMQACTIDFIVDDTKDFVSSTDSTTTWPGNLHGPDMMGPFLQFVQQVEQEHAIRTTLDPITRSSRYPLIHLPLPLHTTAELNSPISDLIPAKRQKTEDTPLGRQVLRAEAFKSTVSAWQPRFEGLRAMRGDIHHAILRLIKVIEWLGRREELEAYFSHLKRNF